MLAVFVSSPTGYRGQCIALSWMFCVYCFLCVSLHHTWILDFLWKSKNVAALSFKYTYINWQISTSCKWENIGWSKMADRKILRSKMEDIDLKVFSLNCNGLHDNVKRTATMQKRKKARTRYLPTPRKTHSASQQEFAWATTWGCRAMYFSHGTSNSRGVAILITSNSDSDSDSDKIYST